MEHTNQINSENKETSFEPEGDVYADKNLKKKYLKEILDILPSYRKKKTIAYILYAVGIGLFALIASVVIIADSSFEGIFVGIMTGTIFLLIPVLIGVSIQTKATRECGGDFYERENERIKFSENGFDYFTLNKYDPSSFMWNNYHIGVKELRSIFINDHVLSITGQGQLIGYKDYRTKELVDERCRRKFYEDTTWRILLDYKEEDLKVIKRECNRLMAKADEYQMKEAAERGWETPAKHTRL